MLGEQLKKAFAEARIGHQEAADGIGVSKANLYNLFKKDTFEVEYLRKASTLTGKPIDYFFGNESKKIETNTDDVKDFGSQVIDKMAGDLSELKRFFEEEIRMKNQQIAGLQRTVDVLVGKSEGADLDQLFTPTGDFGTDLRTYAKAALLNIQTMGSPIFLTPRVAK